MPNPEPIRDLIGYGAAPPRAPWPGNARIAVNFCVNYEEGGERSTLNGDDGSESRVSDLITPRRIGTRDLNMEENYAYGSRVGYWRILQSFAERRLQATVNLVGLAGELVPAPLAAMVAQGWDLQPHGWRWIDYATVAEAEERAHIALSIAQVERLTGAKPLGYYAGMPSLNTRRIVAEQVGFLYDSDCYCDELPYWSSEFARPVLVMPYSLETNDSRFGRAEGYQVAREFVEYITDSFDRLYAEGAVRPRILTIGLHARLIGRPGRIGALDRILDHMLAHDRVWIARRGDVARAWARVYPPS